jgi:hypothetical protein
MTVFVAWPVIREDRMMTRAPWLLALLLAVPIAAAAQQTSRLVPVNVDYLAGQTLYISAGLAQGLFAEDTVTAFCAPLRRTTARTGLEPGRRSSATERSPRRAPRGARVSVCTGA